jgi:hypothetical protein
MYCEGSTRIPKLRRLINELFVVTLTEALHATTESIALIAPAEETLMIGGPACSHPEIRIRGKLAVS